MGSTNILLYSAEKGLSSPATWAKHQGEALPELVRSEVQCVRSSNSMDQRKD